MLHARKLALARMRISTEKIISNYQAQNRIAKKFERFVVKAARLVLRVWRNLFVRPRAVRHRLRQQLAITKVIRDYFFQMIQIFQRGRFHRGDSSKTPSAASK